MMYNHKGGWCCVKPSVFCQEGWCSECQIYQEWGSGDEDNKQAGEARRNREYSIGQRGSSNSSERGNFSV